MSKQAAFLRGVNLGPRRRVSSVQLRSLFEEIGLKTLLESGEDLDTPGSLRYAGAGSDWSS